jgi:hypothetical protein
MLKHIEVTVPHIFCREIIIGRMGWFHGVFTYLQFARSGSRM